jgi:heptosyltransferase-1
MLRHHPDLDEVIEWPLGRWRRLWRERRLAVLAREVSAAVDALRQRRFDLAIDLQGLLKSALPVRLCGAAERIGLGSREGGGLLMTRVVGRGPNSHEISSEYRHLAERLGWPTDGFRQRVYPGVDAEQEAAALLSRYGLDNGYAVLCPFTTRPQKHWVEQRWALLAEQMLERFSLPSVMLGGPGDVDAARSIATGCPDAMVNLVGKTTLLSAAALIERARVVVGVDTGLSHMGVAFQRPTLLLFGSTCPYTETGTDKARVLYHPRDCSPCRRRPTCDGAFTCMRDIGVDEIIDTLAALVQAGAAQ